MSAGKSQPVRTHPLICPDPVFIIGAPRSGTTILAHALGKHTHFWASDESEFLLDLYGGGRIEEAFDRACALEGDSWIRTEDVSRSEFLTFVSLGVNALFTSRSKGKRWIDHTNLYTQMADTLAEMFPQARFVHGLRDGRRAVHSTLHFKHRFESELPNRDVPPLPIRSWVAAGRIAPWAADFREACVVWSQYVEAATDFARRQP